jgi:hypothetical protein
MKFLILLTVLASTSVFANNDKIKCWDSAQENRHHKPAYVFEEKDRHAEGLNREIVLVYPNYVQLEEKHGCLVSGYDRPEASNPRKEFEACLGEGQYINRLVPVEIDDEEEDFEGTVYCEREIKDYLGRDHDMM